MALLKTGFSGQAGATIGSGASASRATAAAGGGGGTLPGGWQPTVVYMLVLIVAEVLIVGWLSRHLLKG